jgi:hypothetical protein
VLFLSTDLKDKCLLSHPILKYCGTSESIPGRGTRGSGVRLAVAEDILYDPWQETIMSTDYIQSVLSQFSDCGRKSKESICIDGEQCYFCCENGEYRLIIRNNL